MRKILLIVCLIFFILPSFANDNTWCVENGGVIDINLNNACVTHMAYDVSYIKKIYNVLCIPFLSSVMNNEPVVFLKLVTSYQNEKEDIFDEYNWKITQYELVKYI